MPKTPFSKKHVKFASIESDADGSDNLQDRESSPLSKSRKETSSVDESVPSHPQSAQFTEIEIHIEDEDGLHVYQPHQYHDHTTGNCSGCRIHGQSPKHRRLTTGDQLESSDADEDDGCPYSPQQGPHIVLLTLLCIPFVFVTALVVTGYLGVLTWYNIFLYYYDDRGWIHRIAVCPLLIFLFPPVIVSTALGISLYSSIKQLSWYLSSWRVSVADLEKGFYAWLCLHLGLQECSPYEVITLDDDEEDDFGRTTSHAVSPV